MTFITGKLMPQNSVAKTSISAARRRKFTSSFIIRPECITGALLVPSVLLPPAHARAASQGGRSHGLGLWLAGATFVLTLLLLGSHRVPPALIVIGLGVIYALLVKLDWNALPQRWGFRMPRLHLPTLSE
jgi:hypothetical protein